MPKRATIKMRSSTITNSFVNSIIPVIHPSDDEVAEALRILGMTEDTVCCAYCGDATTEWDHLRPLVVAQKPTGQISEIGNLVPACGKCNQSKRNLSWSDWISSSARLSPKTRGVKDLRRRIARLKKYEEWKPRAPLDFEKIVGSKRWRAYWENHRQILSLLSSSQAAAEEVREVVARSRTKR